MWEAKVSVGATEEGYSRHLHGVQGLLQPQAHGAHRATWGLQAQCPCLHQQGLEQRFSTFLVLQPINTVDVMVTPQP